MLARSVSRGSAVLPSFLLLVLTACSQNGTPEEPLEDPGAEAVGETWDEADAPEAADDGFVSLFADGLDGWRVVGGEADFTWQDDTLVGSAGVLRRNSFLISPDEYADFELRTEVWIRPGGNSGIQIRSHVDEERNRFFGYQIEIDTSDRAWSGGLYDEGRRGWLDDLKEQDEARAAFRNGEWNEYRIVCRGDHIRSWVNGVPCADFHDDADASGHIGFQVHSGMGAEVKWGKPRIKVLNAE